MDYFPPIHHHPRLTRTLTASSAEKHLSAYLTRSESKPYLHPDAQLSIAGISWSAESGPSGGLALHYLHRIAAGLRRENLVAETAEDLAHFSKQPFKDDAADAYQSPSKSLKRRRSEDEISQWAEDTSEAALGDISRVGDIDADGDWQDKEEYEQEQEGIEGEIGAREAVTMVKQNGAPPTFRTEGAKKGKSLDPKAARKAAKKERRKVEKAEKRQKGPTDAEG